VKSLDWSILYYNDVIFSHHQAFFMTEG
jgi:hypothetical protein